MVSARTLVAAVLVAGSALAATAYGWVQSGAVVQGVQTELQSMHQHWQQACPGVVQWRDAGMARSLWPWKPAARILTPEITVQLSPTMQWKARTDQLLVLQSGEDHWQFDFPTRWVVEVTGEAPRDVVLSGDAIGVQMQPGTSTDAVRMMRVRYPSLLQVQVHQGVASGSAQLEMPGLAGPWFRQRLCDTLPAMNSVAWLQDVIREAHSGRNKGWMQ